MNCQICEKKCSGEIMIRDSELFGDYEDVLVCKSCFDLWAIEDKDFRRRVKDGKK